jgi:hypothetical protein
MKFSAHVYLLGGTVAVAELSDMDGNTFVAECMVDGDEVKVLPQSLRRVEKVRWYEVEVADEATAQDHVDRAAHGLERFRQRLETFEPDWADDAAMSGWAREAIATRDALVGLLGKLRSEKGVAW